METKKHLPARTVVVARHQGESAANPTQLLQPRLPVPNPFAGLLQARHLSAEQKTDDTCMPGQLKASAYAQAGNIPPGPVQEKHFSREARHVVQQKQRPVKTTITPTVPTKTSSGVYQFVLPEKSKEAPEVPDTTMEFADEEELHHLFIAKQEENYELMIASTPQLLKDYVANKINTVTKQVDINKFKEINKKIDIYNQVSGGFKNELGKRIQQLMADAVLVMEKAGTGKNNFEFIPPPTTVEWGAAKPKGKNVIGTSMKADLLSINPGAHAGSEPVTPYKDLGSVYVKGHLLNHHLHGEAKDENLTPMTKTMNTAFEKNFESFIKQKVISENQVFSYQVNTNKMDKSGIPARIEIEAYELKANKRGKWKIDPEGFSIKGSVNQKGNVNNLSIKEGDKVIEEAITIDKDPTLLKDFIDREDTPYNPRLNELEAEYRKIQYEWSSEFGLYLKDIMAEIVSLLTDMFPEDRTLFPKSQIEYGEVQKFVNVEVPKTYGFSDEHGTSMHAKLLSINPGDNHGYEPQEKRWGSIVQGHLLNHHLHGPAESKNLLPISKSLNTQMERDIESVAKKWVLEENEVVTYEVKADDTINLKTDNIQLGKEIEDNAISLPGTPKDEMNDVDDAYDYVVKAFGETDMTQIKKRKVAKNSKKDLARKRLKETEDILEDTYNEHVETYEKMLNYSVPSGISASLQKLTLKNTKKQTDINNPLNWKPTGEKKTFKGKNSLDEKAKIRKTASKRKKRKKK